MTDLRQRVAIVSASALLIAGCTGGSSTDPSQTARTPTTSATSEPPTTSTTPGARVTVASTLDVPWGLALLPDASALVTLRDTAQVQRIRAGQAPVTIGTVAEVEPQGEGGLLGIAVSPQFATDRRVFVYYTTATDNRVQRFRLDGDRLQPERVIVQGIPQAQFHNGGRIAFGPDGQLYVGTGDAGEPVRAQDTGSLGGKILRVTQDGAVPEDNPIAGSLVWSLGHRNVQGLAWDRAGRMFATEFGQNTWDELNLIRPGANYGWPTVEGKGGRAPYVDPLVQWTTSDASPSGLAIGADGAAYVAALSGQSLWRVPLNGTRPGTPERLLDQELGRIRTVTATADGRLWIITSNTFRGTPAADDDRVIILPAPAS